MTRVSPVAMCCALLLAFSACSSDKRAEHTVEAPITPAAASVRVPEGQAAKPLPAPTLGDVRDAIGRVFGDTLSTREAVEFVAGDFNGDQSQDVAVLVHPNPEKLADLNSELANWILEDPARAFLPPENKSVVHLPPKPAPLQVAKGETLLAIIHGYGPEGWRNPQARQGYLLKNSAGEGLSVNELPRNVMARAGVMPGERKVIEERVHGRAGFLFWTGSAYAWHSL